MPKIKKMTKHYVIHHKQYVIDGKIKFDKKYKDLKKNKKYKKI